MVENHRLSSGAQWLSSLGYVDTGYWPQGLPRSLVRSDREDSQEKQPSKHSGGTSLVVQWLRLHAPRAGDLGLISGQGTKIPHATQHESESEVAQSCPTLCFPVGCSLPGSSIQGIFQARVLEWVAISFSRGSSQPKIEPRSPTFQAGALPSEPPGKPYHTASPLHQKNTKTECPEKYKHWIFKDIKE